MKTKYSKKSNVSCSSVPENHSYALADGFSFLINRRALTKGILAEVVYLSGKCTRSFHKSFLVKDRDTLNDLVSFVTDSRFLVLTVRYYENVSWKV